MKENKQDRLMCLFSNNMRPLQQQQTLVSFLAQHPHLAWLHAFKTANYGSASSTLLQSAKMQSKRLARKKTMLSISKLAALAADEPDFRELKDVEAHLNLCSYQETLPQSLVDCMGLDMSTMGVLSQTQLIQVGSSNDTEFLFMFICFVAIHQ
jgi:nuclear pore complex protein Nup133